jgi:RNA polymerase sigma-70 factor (ECF subfamily)
MFACCHPSLLPENQIALALKSLCGFSNPEIARGLLLSEETVKKRIQRARQQLCDGRVQLEVPTAGRLAVRLDAVHQCLYLLFNEGYAASSGDDVVRTDLCEEAVRLCHLLCGHAHCRSPASLALLALMLFHAARFDSRTDDRGSLMLLEDQDRTRWDSKLLARARYYLDHSAEGRRVSLYHLEAGIAMLHCSAARFDQINWRAILNLYDALVQLKPSPIYQLNRAIVLAHLEGPEAGIRVVESLVNEPLMRNYYFVDATLGELYRRAGDLTRAREHVARARDATHSAPERELLRRRLTACDTAVSSGSP